jgi:hypothetical protein
VLDQSAQQRLLVGEVLVQRADRKPRTLGHAVGREARFALLH